MHVRIPVAGDAGGHGAAHRHDALGQIVLRAALVHGVHCLIATAVLIGADAAFKANDVPQTVERAAAGKCAASQAAENVGVLHRIALGEQERIGVQLLPAHTHKDILIVAIAPGDGVLRVVAEAEGLAVCLAVEEAVLALCDTDGGAVPGEGGRHEAIGGAGRLGGRPFACAGLHGHLPVVPTGASHHADGLIGGEGAVPVGIEHGGLQPRVPFLHRPRPQGCQLDAGGGERLILRADIAHAPRRIHGVEGLRRRTPQRRGEVRLADAHAVKHLRVGQLLTGGKIVVIDEIAAAHVAEPACGAQGKTQQTAAPMAFPGDLQPVDVPRALRSDPLLCGAGVAAEVRHDLGVDGGGVRRVGGQLRDMVGVVPRLLVLIGKGALHAVRLGDKAVVIGLVRRRRRRGLQRGYGYLDTACELCAERKAEKHAPRP